MLAVAVCGRTRESFPKVFQIDESGGDFTFYVFQWLCLLKA